MIRKKLTAILLVVLLVSCSTLSDIHTIHARASSGALSLEAGAEVAMLLYSLLETAMIASGVKEGLDDYASGKSLYDAFRSFANSLVLSPDVSYMAGTSYTLSDGSTMSYQEDGVYIVAPDGSTYKSDYNLAVFEQYALPDEEAWRDFRVIEGGGGSSEPGKNPFNHVTDATFSAGFIGMLQQFIEQLQQDKIPDVGGYEYYDVYYDGFEQNAAGDYVISGYTASAHPAKEFKWQRTIINSTSSYPCGGYLMVDGEYVKVMFFDFGRNGFFIRNVNALSYNAAHPDGYSANDISYFCTDMYRLNIPVFDTYENAVNWYKTGDTTGLLNSAAYDYPALADTVPDVLAPLVGVSLSPVVYPAVAQAVTTAAQAIPDPAPAPAPDLAANNNVYEQAVTEAVTEAVPQVNPQPDPDPSQSAPSVDSYKVDLTMVFPFCLPFDLMRLFDALSAEPEAPCFHFPFVVPSLGIDMVVDIDLAFLDSVMEIFRAGILITFIIGLIYSTSKLIRW